MAIKDLGPTVIDKIKELSSYSHNIYQTGVFPLDAMIGGGIYSGKIYELFGPESSGKSTLALEFAKAYLEAKKDTGVVLWLESESAFPVEKAILMGIDLSRVLIEEVDTVEAGFEKILEKLKRAKEKGLNIFIVWDTIAAVTTRKSKTDGQFGGGISEKARQIREFLRNITTDLGATDSVLIFVNQIYDSLDSYGKGYDTPGGRGIKFHASVRLFVKKTAEIRRMVQGREMVVGIKSRVFTEKNKLSTPYQELILTINGEYGIDRAETIADFLKKYEKEYVSVKGAGWTELRMPNGKSVKFQNGPQLEQLLSKDPALKKWVKYLVFRYYATQSSVFKVRFINFLNEVEKEFFGKPVTELTDKERLVVETLSGASNEGKGKGKASSSASK